MGRAMRVRMPGWVFLGGILAVPAATAAGAPRGSAALQRACAAGSVADCVTLARFAFDEGATAAALEKACRAGDPLGCGLMYWAGDAAPKDLARAAAELERACQAGRAVGCAGLAELLEAGQGVAKDPARARALYKKAAGLLQAECERGEGASCLDLAGLYHEGHGVATDGDRATALYAKGCQAGFTPSCRMARLDEMAAKPVRELSAEEFLAGLEDACRAGADWGCIQIAAIYQKGELVPKDAAKAAAYFRKTAEIRQRACDAGDAEACSAAEALYREEGISRVAPSRPKPAATPPPSLLEPGSLAELAARLRQAVGGPVQAVELVIHPEWARLRAVDPQRPQEVREHLLREGRMADPVPAQIDGKLSRVQFALDEVNLAGLPALLAAALQRAALPGGRVTHVAMDRTFSKEVQIRVYVKGGAASAMVVADRQGHILKVL